MVCKLALTSVPYARVIEVERFIRKLRAGALSELAEEKILEWEDQDDETLGRCMGTVVTCESILDALRHGGLIKESNNDS